MAAQGLVWFVFTQECFRVFFEQFNFGHVECVKITISKCLSLAILAGSVILKVPQILKLISAGSATGVSLSLFVLEVIGYSLTSAFALNEGYAFSTWGEAPILLFQSMVVVVLILYYNGSLGFRFLLCAALYGLFAAYLVNPALHPSVLPAWLDHRTVLFYGQASTIGIFSLSRVPQILSNFKLGHTGLLSLFMFALSAGGALARSFTSFQEKLAPIVVAGYLISTTLNGLIMLQILWYWKATNHALASEQERKRR